MKIPNFIFLASPHNVAKAYLAVMLELDLIPERIIFIDFVQPRETGGKFRSFVERIRNKVAGQSPLDIARRALEKMSKRFRPQDSSNEILFEAVARYVHDSSLPKVEFFRSTQEILEERRLPYETIQVTSLNDPRFISLISNASQTVALYVEGGILRKPVLSTHIRFLHIHPGIVPLVKGSACMLWSALVYKKVGMSCFFMNEGIDTGDVLLTREYPLPKIPLSNRYLESQYAEARYLALEDYLGAAYRADVLRALLKQQPDPALWKPQPQDRSAGAQYFYPHMLLLNKAVDKFFAGARS